MKPIMFILCILIIFYTIIGLSDPDDYQLILSQPGMNTLASHFIPLITEEMMALTIEPQTFQDTDPIKVTMELDAISIKNFTIDNIAIALDSSTQTVTMNVINMNLELNTFNFKASARILIDLSCSGSLTPQFANWNMSLTFDTSTNNCSMFITLIESATVIQEGPINLNQKFNNVACDTIYKGADFLLDIEEKIRSEIIDQIPTMINNELQTALDAMLSKSENVGDIRMCYGNITVYTNHLLIGGNFIIPKFDGKLLLPSNISTTIFIDEPDGGWVDDASLVVFFIIIIILSCMVGCGIGIGIFCGCKNDKLKQLKTVKDTDYQKQVTLSPMRVNDDMNDDMTDDDGVGTTVNV
eukprot:249173_1